MSDKAVNLVYVSLIILAGATFTSISINALSHILVFIPAVYFTYDFLKKKDNYKKISPEMWSLILLVIVIALSAIVNIDILKKPFKSFSRSKYFLIGFLSIFAYFKLFLEDKGRDKKIKILLNTFIIATTVASLSGIIGVASGFNPLKMSKACHVSRACGLYGMYMTYGYGISLFLTIITGLIIYKDKVKQYISINLLWSAWVINFIGLFLSYTRGGWIAYLLTVPFFFFKKNKKLFLTIVGISSVVFGATFLFVPKVNKMFLKRGYSNRVRISFYEAAFKAFQEKPVLGWGYKNFESNVKSIKKKYNIKYPDHGGHAHNNLMEHLASTGALGFLTVLSFHLFWIFGMYKREDLVALIAFPFVLNFSISGMFQYTFGDGENLFFIMGAFALSQIRYLRNS